MNTTLIMVSVVVGTIVLGLIAVGIAFKSFYKIPEADEALVRTGGGKTTVSVGGGLFINPLSQKVARVSLQAIRIPISRTGTNALPTSDKLMAEVEGELIVTINPEKEEDIVRAIQKLGTVAPADMQRSVKEQIDSVVTDALRTAAFQKSFLELNSEKKEFGEHVLALLQDDLQKLGLTLTAVTIPSVRQGNFSDDPSDIFAAEGRRNVADVVQRNLEETNKIERLAQIKIQEQDVNAVEQALSLSLRQKQKEADQSREVAEYEATQHATRELKVLEQTQREAEARAAQDRAIQEAQIAEAEKVESARIAKEERIAVRNSQAEAEQARARESALRAEQEALIEKDQAVEAARIAKERNIAVAREEREQAEEEASIRKQTAIELANREQANAAAERAEAEALRRAAEEKVTTVEEQAQAERAKIVTVVRAREEAERDQIAADREAYVVSKQAEGRRDAAMRNAEAVKAEADGRANAQKSQAAGQADAQRTAADGEAYERLTLAEAEFDASEKEAAARIKLAEATLAQGKAEAESARLMQEAKNTVDNRILLQEIALQFVAQAPALAKEIMSPIGEVAENMQVVQINGLGGNGEGGNMGLPQAIMSGAASAVGMAPLLRTLLATPEVSEITSSLRGMVSSAVRDAATEAQASFVDSLSTTTTPSKKTLENVD